MGLLFPPVPHGVSAPQSFPFTIRDLLEEGFAIEPIDHMVDHLTMVNNTIRLFVLAVNNASDLLSYDDNKAAA